jgi:hypothetical protein
MKQVKFIAGNGDNKIELPMVIGGGATNTLAVIATALGKFFQWFDTCKNHKVATGFDSKTPVTFMIVHEDRVIIDSKELEHNTKMAGKYKLNRGEKSKVRFTTFISDLIGIAATMESGQVLSVEALTKKLKDAEAKRKAHPDYVAQSEKNKAAREQAKKAKELQAKKEKEQNEVLN